MPIRVRTSGLRRATALSNGGGRRDKKGGDLLTTRRQVRSMLRKAEALIGRAEKWGHHFHRLNKLVRTPTFLPFGHLS